MDMFDDMVHDDDYWSAFIERYERKYGFSTCAIMEVFGEDVARWGGGNKDWGTIMELRESGRPYGAY